MRRTGAGRRLDVEVKALEGGPCYTDEPMKTPTLLAPSLVSLLLACGGSADPIFWSTQSTSYGGNTGIGGSTVAGGCSAVADCDDGFSCTLDTCTAGVCSHVAGPAAGATACPPGSFCEVHLGCVPSEACATHDQCLQKLGSDPCKTGVQCDPALALCTYGVLDKDSDGHAPAACGGDDCNDVAPAVFPGAPEGCDGEDNDCDGKVDEAAVCPGLATCQAGTCVCSSSDTCAGVCVDKKTDPKHCGACFHECPSAATCKAGICTCASTATICAGECVDILIDPAHCGGCDHPCQAGYSCSAGACACLHAVCAGQCVDLSSDPAHCGSCDVVCPGTACQGGSCTCPAGTKACEGACVDTTGDSQNCGACGAECPPGTACVNSACAGCPAVDLFIMLDLSPSMSATVPTAGTSRLAVAQNGINGFVGKQGQTVGLGLGYFPLQGGACAASAYATPAVAVAPLPGNGPAISASVWAAKLLTTSPTATALQGALAYVKVYEQSMSGHKGAVVLIADGLPDTCTPAGVVTDMVATAAAHAGGAPSVKTYVIALGADVAAASWNAVAAAGGTGAAVNITDTADMHDVQNTLDGIAAVEQSCNPGPCTHDACNQGEALEAGCSACVSAVCIQDGYCCTNNWDGYCTDEVATYCAPMSCD